MQPLFSMFPAGRAGAGLVLLRAACALQLGFAVLSDASPSWLTIAGAIAAAALILGLLTQGVAIACVVVLAFEVLCCDRIFSVAATLQGIDLLALSLLGAGAYSIDARLFGRRVIEF